MKSKRDILVRKIYSIFFSILVILTIILSTGVVVYQHICQNCGINAVSLSHDFHDCEINKHTSLRMCCNSNDCCNNLAVTETISDLDSEEKCCNNKIKIFQISQVYLVTEFNINFDLFYTDIIIKKSEIEDVTFLTNSLKYFSALFSKHLSSNSISILNRQLIL